MTCECDKKGHKTGKHKCAGNCTPLQKKSLATAADQFHKWDNMVFKGIDGVPPLVNVQLSAYTMDFFMREKELLQLLFADNPVFADVTNTNMATVLYDRDKLVGIAIEYGNNSRAYIAMDKLDKKRFIGLPDWQAEPEKHAGIMRARIREYTGRDIGLIKCADLDGFFGGLGKVVENPNTLEMLLEGVKFACSAVAQKHLSIQPEPRFFGYLRMLNTLTDKMDTKAFAEIQEYLPDFAIGLVLQNKKKQYAAVEIFAEKGNLKFQDFGQIEVFTEASLREVTAAVRCLTEETFAVGLSTDFLCSAMHAALTYSPLKLGYSVAKAVAKGQIVAC
ncbi:MAG: hypothetical protein V1734_05145 [Nanoarchaeota archaeon]